MRAGIVGASGYAGGELVRILAGHPGVELTYLCSETYKGQDISAALPNMRGLLSKECVSYDPATAVEQCEVVFLAQSNGWAMNQAAKLLEAGLKVIDLSADFRLKSIAAYQEWYKLSHTSPDLLTGAIYGLPELHKTAIQAANLVANPGCYCTSAILALAPLLKDRLVEPDTVIVDSKSGVSGAGRSSFKLDNHFPELNESMKAYNIGVHRHTPEIEQELTLLAGRAMKISFTPHLIPITRGILTTAYAGLIAPDWTTEELITLYAEFYGSAAFVQVLDAGQYPTTKAVCGGNFCHIGLRVDPRTNRVVVVSALDNMVKGAAGQAVQNMNLMFGLDEMAGLDRAGVYP